MDTSVGGLIASGCVNMWGNEDGRGYEGAAALRIELVRCIGRVKEACHTLTSKASQFSRRSARRPFSFEILSDRALCISRKMYDGSGWT